MACYNPLTFWFDFIIFYYFSYSFRMNSGSISASPKSTISPLLSYTLYKKFPGLRSLWYIPKLFKLFKPIKSSYI